MQIKRAGDTVNVFKTSASSVGRTKMLRGSGRPVFSTFVVKSRIVLARYFLRVGPRAAFMGVWRHFHRGSNFWILTLFGSGYAGLGGIRAYTNVTSLTPAAK